MSQQRTIITIHTKAFLFCTSYDIIAKWLYCW